MLTALLAVMLSQAEPTVVECRTPDAIYEPSKSSGSYSLALSPDGKFLAVGGSYQVVILDTATKKEVATLPGGHAAVAFSPRGGLLAVSGAGITVVDTNTWKVKNTIRHDGGIYRLAFSPDGTVLLSGGTADNRDVILWGVAKGIRQQRIHMNDDNEAVQAVAFTPDGKQFAATVDKKIKLWDHETVKEIREFTGHQGPVVGLAFSPDGSKLASASKDVKLWNVATGKEIALPTKIRNRYSVSWSPDGKRLALSNYGGAHVINFDKPDQVLEIHALLPTPKGAARGAADCICFSPDNKYLYAAGVQGRLVTRWKLDVPVPAESQP
jgi:WD40 repeat protein